MSLHSRRRFLKSCGASLAGLMGVGLIPQQASARLTYSIARGFSDRDVALLRESLNLLAGRFTHPDTIADVYRIARRSFVDGPYSQVIGLPIRSDWSWSCLNYQMSHYLQRRPIPRILLYPYFSRENYWANANVGVVRTHDITRCTGHMTGEFTIHVNRFWLGNGAGAHPAVWAGCLAHELMHGLGHIHGNDEYTPELQINAIYQSIYNACAPMISSDHGDTEEFQGFGNRNRFCGCGG